LKVNGQRIGANAPNPADFDGWQVAIFDFLPHSSGRNLEPFGHLFDF